MMIGTAAEGQTYPGASMPYAMTQWTPQTQEGETKCVPPYYYADTRIQGFRGSHFLSGSCAQDYGSFTVMPLVSAEKLDAQGRSAAFSHAHEVARPYLYAVDLQDSGIHAEITGSERSGMMEFHFPASAEMGWIDVEDNIRLGTGAIRIDARRQEITGYNPVHRIYAGNGKNAGFSGYVVIQFDQPFEVGGTWTPAARHEGAIEQQGESGAAGAYVRFRLPESHVIHVRIGTSFVSVDEARRNLEAEMPDFDFMAAVQRSRDAWTAALGRFAVGGNSPDRSIFYTALYHAMLLPRIYSDRSGTYPKFAGDPAGGQTELAKGFTYYCDYSVWDTFRAVHPLLTLVDPARDLDMVKSLIAKGEQGGYLPIFPAWSEYTNEMVGDHAGVILADAYVKGIRGFDVEEAYRLMRKNATETPEEQALYEDGRGRRALPSYVKYGYIPLEDPVPFAFHGNEQVSRTLEYAFDDFEVSVMAKALGHAEDAAMFARRAQSWRNVLDPETGLARGRHADGTWVTPFEPGKTASYITEGLPWQYTFFVPQDIPALIAFEHGPEKFAQKLDELFAGGFYDHGNEPSHHIAYLYDDAGKPWKTQLHVHEIMQKEYRNAPAGLAGNDDAGQISAWYVMSAMGIYSVTPGTPRYAIGTPHFDEMRVRMGSGRELHIVAHGAEAGQFYVRTVRLNGREITRPYLLHEELEEGGELEFTMSDQPMKGKEEVFTPVRTVK
ncbi:hypothetical protein GCM10011586_26540 [Silvibacterium dinghuense]|nr:hypothetical protein GCM10011586_26540 [Silvibacterium dinghuense]